MSNSSEGRRLTISLNFLALTPALKSASPFTSQTAQSSRSRLVTRIRSLPLFTTSNTLPRTGIAGLAGTIPAARSIYLWICRRMTVTLDLVAVLAFSTADLFAIRFFPSSAPHFPEASLHQLLQSSDNQPRAHETRAVSA